MSYTLTENYQIDEFTIKAIIGENISDENCDFQKFLPERSVLTDENIICIFENGDAFSICSTDTVRYKVFVDKGYANHPRYTVNEILSKNIDIFDEKFFATEVETKLTISDVYQIISRRGNRKLDCYSLNSMSYGVTEIL